ncbi:unnamed protein product [Urochloa humidicola]
MRYGYGARVRICGIGVDLMRISTPASLPQSAASPDCLTLVARPSSSFLHTTASAARIRGAQRAGPGERARGGSFPSSHPRRGVEVEAWRHGGVAFTGRATSEALTGTPPFHGLNFFGQRARPAHPIGEAAVNHHKDCFEILMAQFVVRFLEPV